MKIAGIESTMRLDPVATWNEVQSALSISSEGAFALVGAGNDFHEMDSDFSGSARNLPEDILWLMISKMVDPISN
jgi:hypothetical protein